MNNEFPKGTGKCSALPSLVPACTPPKNSRVEALQLPPIVILCVTEDGGIETLAMRDSRRGPVGLRSEMAGLGSQ